MSSRIRIVACICVIGMLEAFVYGLSFPFFTLRLQQAGLSPVLIGLNATCGAVGVLPCGRLYPKALVRLGYRDFSALAFVVALVSIGALLASPAVPLWFAVRFVLGIAEAGLWISTEAWLNHVVADAHRGRANAVFQALYGLGFFLGPAATYLTGYRGPAPVLVMVALCAAALVVLVFADGSAPLKPDELAETRWRDLYRLPGARGILSLSLLVGICETAVYTLLPVYGIRHGLSSATAVSLLVAYTLGEIVVALPIGWLADRFDREKILAFCAGTASVCMVLLVVAIRTTPLAQAVAFLAGGLVVSLSNIALILLGQRFARGNLPLMSTAFSIAYSVGSIAGSALGGASMSAFGPAGLPVPIAVLLAGVALFFLAPRLIRTRTTAPSPGEGS
jgi:MFS family permease